MKPRLTYANLTSSIALFLALGGVSYAAINVPAASIGTRELRNGSVTSEKLATGAVSSAKIADGKVSVSHLDPIVRAFLKVPADFGRQVVTSDGKVLGTFVNRGDSLVAGRSDGQETFIYLQPNGKIAERSITEAKIALNGLARATESDWQLFYYKGSNCTGPPYIITAIPLATIVVSQLNAVQGNDSPFGGVPFQRSVTSERFEPASLRLSDGSMYTYADGSCIQNWSNLTETYYGDAVRAVRAAYVHATDLYRLRLVDDPNARPSAPLSLR